MATEVEKNIEKILLDLQDGYEKAVNWEKAMKEIVSLFKKQQKDSESKLRSDRRTLASEVDTTSRALKKAYQEISNYKKVKVPNLQKEIIKLQQQLKQNGSSSGN